MAQPRGRLSVKRREHLVQQIIHRAHSLAGGENGPDACQQALGVRENVAVETRTCEAPTFTTNPNYGGDPKWAVPDAERLASAMLKKVRV